ncbi:uncharacterized protein LOC129576660 [Sitodiplosis mosellana]|uniref:uncharacterized protein LOC129576660 n=1 Tax=Sitodiplosis mosellana TaxID=263140 RepID=UPI00244417DF|nr:uncharacterized protein LOC129576660 [Sitodiplosis mosellana]
MWKYVGQRLKDSAEQTCSHIKNLRSTFSTCNTNTGQQDVGKKEETLKRYEISRDGRILNSWNCFDPDRSQNKAKKNPFDIDAPYIIQKCYQKQKQKQQEAFNGWMELNLLQWTAGFLASLYFGQMICFYSRRRQNLKRWHHMEQLLNERTLRQMLEKQSIYQRSFVPSNDEHHWYDANRIHRFRALMELVPVSNDHVNQNQLVTNNTLTSATQTAADHKSDVSIAVEDLIATLGSIEFRLGMQNFRANEPEVAVSHLKLATTHRHKEATFNLGVCYELGVGVEKSTKNAMECYRAAASLGHKKAMYNLGVFYVHGWGGLKKNRDAARACFEAADKMGLPQATRALTLPETPVKKDEEIFWKSNDFIANKLGAIHQRRESSVI